MIRFECPTCGERLVVRNTARGKTCKCGCGEVLRVPYISSDTGTGLTPNPAHHTLASPPGQSEVQRDAKPATAPSPHAIQRPVVITPTKWVLIIACGVLMALSLYNLIVRWHESKERQRQDEANRIKEEKANAFKRGEAQGHAGLARLEGQALERNSIWALILIKAKWQEPTTRKLKHRIESQAEYQERL